VAVRGNEREEYAAASEAARRKRRTRGRGDRRWRGRWRRWGRWRRRRRWSRRGRRRWWRWRIRAWVEPCTKAAAGGATPGATRDVAAAPRPKQWRCTLAKIALRCGNANAAAEAEAEIVAHAAHADKGGRRRSSSTQPPINAIQRTLGESCAEKATVDSGYSGPSQTVVPRESMQHPLSTLAATPPVLGRPSHRMSLLLAPSVVSVPSAPMRARARALSLAHARSHSPAHTPHATRWLRRAPSRRLAVIKGPQSASVGARWSNEGTRTSTLEGVRSAATLTFTLFLFCQPRLVVCTCACPRSAHDHLLTSSSRWRAAAVTLSSWHRRRRRNEPLELLGDLEGPRSLGLGRGVLAEDVMIVVVVARCVASAIGV
jgi:hypothetical protein